ncbi:hypothetical protein ABMA28_013401 [Loxostege sticticalis]|uniref:Uncharacterized protein n=1 Tax=Loxostege sticticalis TaxID=481309 RepID=A0ABD0TI71_LOXSC
MENNDDPNNEKKFVNKAKSCNSGPSAASRLKSEAVKRKSLYVNDAVRSLDLALGRLKKSKLVNGEYCSSSQANSDSTRQGAIEMFMDASRSFSFNQSLENASLLSMNFSHYELMRNLSESNCNSDGAFSGTTNSRYMSPTDLSVKDEHLEKYFRSIEMWSRNHKGGSPNNVHFELPEK